MYTDLSKLKVFPDDNMNVVKIMGFICETVENIVGKGIYAGYQQILVFLQCFQVYSKDLHCVVKSKDCGWMDGWMDG